MRVDVCIALLRSAQSPSILIRCFFTDPTDQDRPGQCAVHRACCTVINAHCTLYTVQCRVKRAFIVVICYRGYRYPRPNVQAIFCIAMHCTILYRRKLKCTVLHYIKMQPIALLHTITLHCVMDS